MAKTSCYVTLVVALIFGWCSPGTAAEYQLRPNNQTPSANEMIFDALVGRPVGLATTAVCTGAFIATLPFTIPSQSVGSTGRHLVGDTAAWTFTRPMGKNYFRSKGFWLP